MNTFRYFLYGIEFESDIELPEVPAATSFGAPGARIRVGPTEPEGMYESDYKFEGSSARFRIQIPEVGRLVISKGSEILVDPEPDADPTTLRLYLLGSGLGTLLYQRDLMVMHGNAVRVDDACAICIGPSGVGKSSLAAEFLQRGYQLLADDVVPLGADAMAVPGFPRIKLWQDAADRMGISTEGLRRIQSDMDKFDISLGDAFCTDVLPVRWIYCLSKDSDPGIRITPLEGLKRMPPIMANSYRPEFVARMSLQQRQLTAVSGLVSRVSRVAEVSRSEESCGPGSVADAILADIIAHPS